MAGTSSSYADRIARQYEQQFGRPADANDPHYAEYVKIALPQMIAADRAALEKSQGRWRVADRIATGASLGLLGAGIGSAFMGGGGAAAASSPEFSVSTVPFEGAVASGAPLASAGAGTGLSAATVGTGTAAGVGAGAGAGAAKGLLGGLSARDIAALGLTGGSLIGSALSDKPNMDPTTQTTDPNLQKLIQTMQGRLSKSEPLYDSILSMANGLLPTQYQKGGGGMG